MFVIGKCASNPVSGYSNKVECLFDGTRKQAEDFCIGMNWKSKKYTYYVLKVTVVKPIGSE